MLGDQVTPAKGLPAYLFFWVRSATRAYYFDPYLVSGIESHALVLFFTFIFAGKMASSTKCL